MSSEIKQIYTSGYNLYATRRNNSSQVALTDGSVFENYGAGGHDADDYDVTLTDKSGAFYLADFDNSGNISSNQSALVERYTIEVFRRVGANPADSDPLIGAKEIVWNKLSGEVNFTLPVETGAGAIPFTYTLTSDVDATPIGDADVWVTTDTNGNNVIASGKTDQNGEVTFYLDAGTVYVWRQKSGWIFDNPDTEVVS